MARVSRPTDRPKHLGAFGFDQPAPVNSPDLISLIPLFTSRLWMEIAPTTMTTAANNAPQSDSIARRAALFLEINHPGAHKDKRVARALGVSPAMAKLLRAGRGWTVARLDQATLRWPKFQAFVWPQAGDFDDRLDRVLEEISAVRDEINNLKAKLGRE